MRTLRSEDKGQAGACPDQTRAIPCTVQAVTGSLAAMTNRGARRSMSRRSTSRIARPVRGRLR